MAKREMKTTKKEDVIDEMVTSEVEEKVEEVTPKTLVGIVVDCAKLNVRKTADVKADVIAVIDVKTEVTVKPDESVKDWYKVNVKGVDGFCMKKFIKIKD